MSEQLSHSERFVIPQDVTAGSLTPEQVKAMTDALSRHHNCRVAPVNDYCQGFYDWHDAIKAKVARIRAGEENESAFELEQWEAVLTALATLVLPIGKSSMLDRRIYGGEKLRTRMCPEHKGRWVGLPFGPSPCGCDLTGWLRED